MAGQWPYIERLITAGDVESKTGTPVKAGNKYKTELLEASGSGSVLKSGGVERLTLKWAKQPIDSDDTSEEAFTRIKLDDGSTYDISHRTPDAMVTSAISFRLERLSVSEFLAVRRFARKIGNHTLVRVVDPNGTVVYAKQEGSFSHSRKVRYVDAQWSFKQEPGVTSL